MRPANTMPQVVQFPQMQQTVPVQVPISTGNGQTIYQTVHVPLQAFAGQIPGLVQPQMQIFPQIAQVANIITPSGQIQQVQLAPMNQLQSLQSLQAAQAAANQQPNVIVQPTQNLTQVSQSPVNATNVSNALVQTVPNSNGIQTMATGPDSQPITITNAQGQQITVIPTQALQQIRSANAANIIQMPSMSAGIQAFPVQNIPGLGNVQVIPASAFNGATNVLAPMPQAHTMQQQHQQPPQQQAAQQQNQVQQNQPQQTWNNTNYTNLGVITPILEEQQQKPQLTQQNNLTRGLILEAGTITITTITVDRLILELSFHFVVFHSHRYNRRIDGSSSPRAAGFTSDHNNSTNGSAYQTRAPNREHKTVTDCRQHGNGHPKSDIGQCEHQRQR